MDGCTHTLLPVSIIHTELVPVRLWMGGFLPFASGNSSFLLAKETYFKIELVGEGNCGFQLQEEMIVWSQKVRENHRTVQLHEVYSSLLPGIMIGSKK